MNDLFSPALIEDAMDYQEYRDLIDNLLSKGKVTGDFMDNNEDILHYTKMNISRMKRGDKTFKLQEEIKVVLAGLSEKWLWLIMTEGWCGDAAQIIPALVQIAAASPQIDTKFILRDEHPQIMDEYLTEGGRSIPKLICLNPETLKEIGNWGPRPEPAQQMTRDYKNDESLEYATYVEALHKWYAKDRYKTVQKELLVKMKSWALLVGSNIDRSCSMSFDVFMRHVFSVVEKTE